MRRLPYKEEKLRRNHRITLMLNNREMRAFSVYCNRFRVKNKSEFLRETVMRTVLKRFEDEHPTLWEENEPDLFSQNLLK